MAEGGRTHGVLPTPSISLYRGEEVFKGWPTEIVRAQSQTTIDTSTVRRLERLRRGRRTVLGDSGEATAYACPTTAPCLRAEYHVLTCDMETWSALRGLALRWLVPRPCPSLLLSYRPRSIAASTSRTLKRSRAVRHEPYGGQHTGRHVAPDPSGTEQPSRSADLLNVHQLLHRWVRTVGVDLDHAHARSMQALLLLALDPRETPPEAVAATGLPRRRLLVEEAQLLSPAPRRRLRRCSSKRRRTGSAVFPNVTTHDQA